MSDALLVGVRAAGDLSTLHDHSAVAKGPPR